MRGSEFTSDTAKKTTCETLNKDWDDLLFNVRISIRYHSKRANFFGFLCKANTAISILCGSAVVTFVMSSSYHCVSIVLGAFVTLISTISLVWGWSFKEQLHSELKIRFIYLEKSMSEHEKTENFLKEYIAERLSIEASEPKIVRTLNTVCYNEQVIADGREGEIKLNFLHKLLYQTDLLLLFLDIENKNIKNKDDKEYLLKVRIIED